RVGDVVDRHHLQVGPVQREAREGAPDPAEAVMPTLVVMILFLLAGAVVPQPAGPGALANSGVGHERTGPKAPGRAGRGGARGARACCLVTEVLSGGDVWP